MLNLHFDISKSNFNAKQTMEMTPDDFDIRDTAGRESDRDIEKALRPLAFDDFSGQDKIIANLRVFVQAARMRG